MGRAISRLKNILMVSALLITVSASALINVTSSSAYSILGKWDHSCISHDQDIQLIEALRTWQKVSGVTDCGISQTPDIKVVPWNEFMPAAAIGVSYPSVNAGGVMWACQLAIRPGLQPEQMRNVYLHETGHCLGLGHSEDPDAIMWPYAAEQAHGLAQDDIKGIRSLYGLPPSFKRFVGGLAQD